MRSALANLSFLSSAFRLTQINQSYLKETLTWLTPTLLAISMLTISVKKKNILLFP